MRCKNWAWKRSWQDDSIELDPATANPVGPKPVHPMLANHLIDKAAQSTRAALDRVLAFLHQQFD